MALHDLITSGMEFAYKLVEREARHRSAAFFLGRDELVEYFPEVSLLALYRRGRGFDELLRNVLDLRVLFGVIESVVVFE